MQIPEKAGGRGARWVLYGGAYLLLLLIHLLVVKRYADDWWFMEQSADYSLWGFLSMYYQGVNGRLMPNAILFFLPHVFWLWQLLNPLVILACAWVMPRLALGKVRNSDFLLSLCLLLSVESRILREAAFWATGSVNYLWPITATLFLLIPFADAVFRGQAKMGKGTLALLPLALFAGGSSEQIGLCALGFMVCAVLFLLVKRRTAPLGLLPLLLLTALSFGVLVAAPGTRNRFHLEITNYFPNFLELTLPQRLGLGLGFVEDRIFGLLLLPSLLAYGLSLWQGWRGTGISPAASGWGRMRWALLALPVLALAPLLLRDAQDVLYTFETPSGSFMSRLLMAFPYVFWAVFLGAFAWVLLRARPLYALLLLAAVCALVVLCFSPTIYASGYRTAMASAVLLLLIVLWQIPPEGRARQGLLYALPLVALVNVGLLAMQIYYWHYVQ